MLLFCCDTLPACAPSAGELLTVVLDAEEVAGGQRPWPLLAGLQERAVAEPEGMTLLMDGNN